MKERTLPKKKKLREVSDGGGNNGASNGAAVVPPIPAGRQRPWSRWSKTQRTITGAAVAAVLLIGAAFFFQYAGGSPARERSTSSPHAVPPRGLDTIVYDRFDRNAPLSLATAETGQRWTSRGAGWHVVNGQAAVTAPDSNRRTIAVVPVGTDTYRVQVQVAKVAAGVGLVFRYQDPSNCWLLTAAPRYGTWTLQKIIAGKSETVAGIGSVDVADGAVIAVSVSAHHIEIAVNGVTVRTLDDTDLAGSVFAGIVATADDDGAARLDDFVVTGGP